MSRREKNKEEAKARASELLKNPKLFDQYFEETFKKYDKNRDNTINLGEYIQFLQDMLTSSGRNNYSIQVASLNFDRADKDSNGQIDKQEFKKELKKRLNEIVNIK